MEIVRQRRYRLLEALAGAIATGILEIPAVQAVTVTVRKLRPPVAADMASAGVRLRRERADGSDMSVEAFLGLGSNMGDRMGYLELAVEVLRGIDPDLTVSPVYETAPLGGPEPQNRYLNCVVRLETDLSARQLLEVAHGLEELAGRVRTVRNGPRTLDVDILLVGDLQIAEPDLVVPHPRMYERGFVLAPLEDLDASRVPAGWRARLAETDPVSLDVRLVGRLRMTLRHERHLVTGPERRELTMTTVRIIGPGRAGRSFASCVRGCRCRGSRPSRARRRRLFSCRRRRRAVARGPRPGDRRRRLDVSGPCRSTVVAHCSGALGLEVLAPHERVAALHPLVTLPDAAIGAAAPRLAAATSPWPGDQAVTELVLALGGRTLEIPAEARAGYHAAACMASNHLVALLGQVQRVAASVGLPLEAFLPLAQGALDDVGRLGPAAALTGPVARGDLTTIERHREVLDPARARRLRRRGRPRASARGPGRRRWARPHRAADAGRRGSTLSAAIRLADRRDRLVELVTARDEFRNATSARARQRRPARPRSHDGRVPRGAHVAVAGRGVELRRGGGEHLREPAPVLLRRGPGAVPGQLGAGPGDGAERPA